MAGKIFYRVSDKDRIVHCPHCGFKITVMWSTTAACLQSTCSHCDNIWMKVFNPVACIGCGTKCEYPKVIMKISEEIKVD
jgi:DNA-directed RNA polymerase subunit RPC12/RpoP